MKKEMTFEDAVIGIVAIVLMILFFGALYQFNPRFRAYIEKENAEVREKREKPKRDTERLKQLEEEIAKLKAKDEAVEK